MAKFFDDFGKYLFVTICAILLWEVTKTSATIPALVLLPVAIATVMTFCVNGLRFLFSK